MNINTVLKINLLFIIIFSASISHAELSAERKIELQYLLKHDCGSCHGMTLKGGLGPALLAENLKDKPDEYLFFTIRHGRSGTPMPAWINLLSQQDTHWIIKLLRNSYIEDNEL
jgi:cytochrome c55X